MATRVGAGLPPPPQDLAGRPLPIKRLRDVACRIHPRDLECFHFSKTGSGRFDDPLGKYAVLYAALRPEAAFAEVFLRRLSWMLIRELDLQERVLSNVLCKGIQCVDLTGAGLRAVSCDNRISTEKPYVTTGLWSRAFFVHPQKPDGIIYRSRHNPRFKCVALFDRCRAKLTLVSSEPLTGRKLRGWTVDQVAKYGLALEPNV